MNDNERGSLAGGRFELEVLASLPEHEAKPCLLEDPYVAAVHRGAAVPRRDWASRALYVGEEGARSWLSVVHEPGYPLSDPDAFSLRQNHREAISGWDFQTLVSLGPGDGAGDAELLSFRDPTAFGPKPGESARRLRYIPVDISKPLLDAAMERLAPLAEVAAAFLCDFEDDHGLLADAIRRFAVAPVLYSLLGGTLGNLERGEGQFFETIRNLMRRGDGLLIDVPLAGPRWSTEHEPRLRASGYSEALRNFLTAGGAGHLGYQQETLDFDQAVRFSHTHEPETEAESITVSERSTGRKLLTFRRYRWNSILSWFGHHGLRVAFARSALTSPQDRFGMGVVLLTLE
jgi:hypothetical protein